MKNSDPIGKLKALLKKPSAPYFIIVVFAGFISMALQLSSNSTPTSKKVPGSDENNSADTYIPAGFVLVPIEIQNLQALDSIIGKSGTVDLFRAATLNGDKPQLVKRRARILRAPRNPNQFAALVKESEVGRILASPLPLYAVVQNPQHTNPVKTVEKKRQQKRRIIESLVD